MPDAMEPIRVTFKPHYNVMTDAARKFHDAGGKKVARLLFCCRPACPSTQIRDV